jgi:hypothetical protein
MLAVMSSLEHSMDEGKLAPPLEGGAEEWLRRIVVTQSLVTVPDTIAFALVAVGFVQKTPDGGFSATEAGEEYLSARGIPTRPRYARRR